MVRWFTHCGCALTFAAVVCFGVPVCTGEQTAEPPVLASEPAPNPARATTPTNDAESRSLGLPREGSKSAATPTPGVAADFARTALSLAGVVALAVFASIVVRKLAKSTGGLGAAMGAGGRSPAGVLEVLGRYPISRGQTLVLLKLDRRVLLLSQAAGGRGGSGAMNCLTEITDPDEVASLLIKTRDAESTSLASRFEESLGAAESEVEQAELGLAQPSERRTTVSAAGDRVELLSDLALQRPQSPVRGFAAQSPRPPVGRSVHESRPDVDAAAEILRKRLHSIDKPKRGNA